MRTMQQQRGFGGLIAMVAARDYYDFLIVLAHMMHQRQCNKGCCGGLIAVVAARGEYYYF